MSTPPPLSTNNSDGLGIVDNFNVIGTFLAECVLHTDGHFVQILVMQRKKDDGPAHRTSTHGRNKVLLQRNVYTVQALRDMRADIISMCVSEHARCYIHVNARSDEQVSAQMLKYTVDTHLSKSYGKMEHAYTHVCGMTQVHNNQYYLVDIDFNTPDVHDQITVNAVVASIEEFQRERRARTGRVWQIPTPNGWHVLAPSFDVVRFGQHHPTVGNVNKNALTLVFAPLRRRS